MSAQNLWGKVSPEEWAVKVCPIDTSANAMVLIDSEFVSFKYNEYGLNTVYEVYKRIKLLNKEGFGYATIKIPYYSHLNSETFEQLDAQILTKDEAGQVRATKLKSNAIFDEDMTDFWTFKKFAFPEVTEGSIIEYRYTLVARSFGSLHDWFFQSEMPTLRSAIKLKVPDYVHYTATPQGDVNLNQYKSEPYSEFMDVNMLVKGGMVRQQQAVNGMVSYYVMKNIPALKPEAYVTTVDDYRARMTFPLYSITIPYDKIRMFNESWDEIGAKLMKSDNFGQHLNEIVGEHLVAAKTLTNGLPDTMEKIKAVYTNLTSKMKWNGQYRLYPSRRLSKSYTEGSGNSSDINILLIAMLRAAGIKSDPVLVSTRNNGMIARAYPRYRQFNNVIALVEVDSTWILLDAASPFKPFQLLGENNLNYQGLRINKKSKALADEYNSTWIDINPSKNATKSLISTITIDSAGYMGTKTIFTATDYPAVKCREQLEKESPKDCLKSNIKFSNGVDLKDEKVENEKDFDKKLRFSFTLENKENALQGGFLYVNPFPVKFITDNPFKLTSRTYPVDFGYPFQQNILGTITIPDNYKVSELPKSMNIKLSDGSAGFTFLAAQVENSIQIKSTLSVNQNQFKPNMYEDLKMLYAKMIDVYNTTIVLEKNK